MKKIVSVCLLFFVLLLIPLLSCSGRNDADADADAGGGSACSDSDDGSACSDSGDSSGDSDTSVTSADEKGGGRSGKEEMKDGSIKILAIGNSFSTDCMEYLYQMLKSAGYEDIVLGNLYYGGCSLKQHVEMAKDDSPSYKYFKNTDGRWRTVSAAYRMSAAVKDDEWDIITLQQTSKTCGIPATYGRDLDYMVDYVSKNGGGAKIVWNMTWAYQKDSTHKSFPLYGKSQEKMYDMIIDCMNKCILPEKRFETFIPCMTSIQNARTSFIGDKLTRDGFHLDYYIGRYIAGLTWFATLTGMPADRVKFNPAPGKITDDMIKVAVESTDNAIKNPLKVTESKIKEGSLPASGADTDPSVILMPEDFLEEDTALAKSNGRDLAKYTLLKWDYLENAYWNCSSSATFKHPSASQSTYKQNVCADRQYGISEVPAGTIIVTDEGWQLRIETYTEQGRKYEGERKGFIRDRFFELTAEYIGDAKFLAWNLSSNPKSDISAIYAQAAAHVRIYVPKP